jgi:hypothetical protein
MASETITIEIRFDHADRSKDELLTQVCRTAAKQILTTAMLLQDRRTPQIVLMSSNMFEREKEISLADGPDEALTTLEAQDERQEV